MKFFKSSFAFTLKLLLLIIGSLIALGTWYYTQTLVNKLQKREKEIVELYAKSLEYITSTTTMETDLTFIFQNIIQRIDFPLILTDQNHQLISSEVGIGYKNIEIKKGLSKTQIKKILNEKLEELKSKHPPISVKTPDGKVIQYLYYGDSEIIEKLKYYPYLQILFAIFFLIIAYSSFNYIRKNEQSSIWVGMAKETAHQLGTPISSLLGWNEILRMNYDNPDKVFDIAEEIKNDLNRLNKITTRFSKIGSQADLKDESPYEIILKVIHYFERRIPQLGKNIVLSIHGDKEVKAKINPELFEWVIENLIKNALDAIENKDGKIDFNIYTTKKLVHIEISDTGKGIEQNKKKEIFKPGYSTKKRGWGLGLSLSKRIIENYHKGKIFVKESIPNKGTTFKIILNRSKSEI
ncbi:sensor histidine kinase [Rosettibacter firmus]|uniref:sensor histidine kinase n=1 Tax=Rosettibacter firmus TaxID=3111522 RepID=UPI00336BB302